MSSKKILFITIIIMSLLIGCYTSREGYVSAHPELKPNIKEAILKGEIVAGMTREEVRASLGEPPTVAKGYEAGRHGRYGKYAGQCHYWHYNYSTIIFGEDGRVVDIK
jgi:outer membrane protein assembly factor BamE (lipoprotein component of BamABCDE complex)